MGISRSLTVVVESLPVGRILQALLPHLDTWRRFPLRCMMAGILARSPDGRPALVLRLIASFFGEMAVMLAFG